jgi:hypothetical protein
VKLKNPENPYLVVVWFAVEFNVPSFTLYPKSGSCNELAQKVKVK